MSAVCLLSVGCWFVVERLLFCVVIASSSLFVARCVLRVVGCWLYLFLSCCVLRCVFRLFTWRVLSLRVVCRLFDDG